MTLSEIYETALCLGEKTDDATGYIDDEYMRQHKMKAFEIIRQCIIKLSAIENIEIVHPEKLEEKSEVNLPLFMTKVIKLTG